MTPRKRLEGNRAFPFTLERRDRCVAKIMEETGIDKWQAEISYRISTANLIGKRGVTDDGGQDGSDV